MDMDQAGSVGFYRICKSKQPIDTERELAAGEFVIEHETKINGVTSSPRSHSRGGMRGRQRRRSVLKASHSAGLSHNEGGYATISIRHFFVSHLKHHESASDVGIPIALDVGELKPFVRLNSGFGSIFRGPAQACAMAGDTQ